MLEIVKTFVEQVKGQVTPNTSWSSLSSLDGEDNHGNFTGTENKDYITYKIPGSTSCLLDYESVCKKPASLVPRSETCPVIILE